MNSYLISALSVFALWQLGFIYAARKKRNDLADVLWGLSFAIAAWAVAWAEVFENSQTLGVAEFLPLLAVTFWGLRLSYHIATRFFSHDDEDKRYAGWRREWGSTWFWRSYLQVFTLQPLLALVIAWPLMRAMTFVSRDLTPMILAGAGIWLIGFLFESIGDAQLKDFTRDPKNKGRVMDRGLWSWTRHPNYFGEVTQWWGVYLMCVEPSGWWLVFSPLTITFLILKVSGVPMLEELMKDRPGYAEYAARVSKFFPRPPKRC